MTATTATPVPWPLGATQVTEWPTSANRSSSVASPARSRHIPDIRYKDGEPATVSIDGTQLFNGVVEERCIRLTGVSWEDMVTSEVARKLSTALAEAADDLDRLEGPR